MKDFLRLSNRTFHRTKVTLLLGLIMLAFCVLGICLGYLMLARSEHYSELATELHERERSIKASRGKILDRNGVVLADNQAVCTISVIHSQITDPEQVIAKLSQLLEMEEEKVRKKVEKKSAREKVADNVPKELGDRIRLLYLDGVKVDEDYKRFYPYDDIGSKVLGFTGSDNQGIIGLEVKYDDYLQGEPGTILTLTDAKGVELMDRPEDRVEPVSGNNLVTSLDWNIQTYANQLAKQVCETKEADSVSILVMNPQNGEIMAMVNVPEFHLNQPYLLPEGIDYSEDALNRMWRNGCINDTYEPGSTFKIITASAGLECGAVHTDDTFFCNGFIMVGDRRIRCHKTTGHGSQDFVHATMNSCNPSFVSVGLRIGGEAYYDYFRQFGLLDKTGVDLPGEAGTIMHRKEDIGEVELATISFGQSFQITPIRLATTVSALINGGYMVTPHIGVQVENKEGEIIKDFSYPRTANIVSGDTSATMRYILEQVVENGTGKNGYVEGFRVGGKTATSQTLPRGSGKYIASFLGFAPADNPRVLALAIINNPKGTYYGGQIAAPVVRTLFENILPYLEQIDYNE